MKAEELTQEGKVKSGSCFSKARGTASVIFLEIIIPDEESLEKDF